MKNNRAPLLCYFKLCASFQSHQRIKAGDAVRNWVKIGDFLSSATLKFDEWLFFKKRTPSMLLPGFLCEFIVELRSGNDQIGAKFVLTSVTLTFDLWPWLFAGTSLLTLVITPENFMTIRWEKHCENGRCGRWTDKRTELFLELLSHS